MIKFLALATTLLFSLNNFASNVSGDVEITSTEVRNSDGILIDSYQYYESFIVRDSILIGINSLNFEFEFGALNCTESVCTGGPFYNDADLPEVMKAVISLDSEKEGLIEVEWDDTQNYKVKFTHH
ncbi:hypothetical protein A9Q84_16945 [Halobacteriovorax marinus]|uniref:Lipoprotein n=1 Tax=Halobacteriovorax marinus TaxID=97084 RepID=A0A1Y5FAE7_9BACT|nr:hypothetical protein A9Q84_16945 [Halobacteriovorax marinus]